MMETMLLSRLMEAGSLLKFHVTMELLDQALAVMMN